MFIKQLFLQNFRNIETLEMNCHPNINVIFGENGQGKSNLLESIGCLSMGKSFRTSNDKPLLRFEQPLFYIKALSNDSDGEMKVELAYDGQKKKVKVNGVVKAKLIEFIGSLKTVSFIPEDLNLIKEGSSERRKFIDMLLCQSSKKYTMSLAMYQKIIEQRNKMLKERPSQLVMMLNAWDAQLAQYGAEVWLKRKEAFEYLNPIFKDYFNRLTHIDEEVSIEYTPSLKEDFQIENLQQVYFQKLQQNRSQDIARGYTTCGPHRDEITILFNEHDSKIYASQGQQRLIALALKMAEMRYIEDITQEHPILLLDDIFSELDRGKIHNILTLLQEEKRQTFITTAYEIDMTNFEHQTYIMRKGVLGS